MQVTSNDQLYFGDLSFDEELSSIASLVFQILEDVIKQEMHLVSSLETLILNHCKTYRCSHVIGTLVVCLYKATRGRLALDACNCLLVSFKVCARISFFFFSLGLGYLLNS